MKKELRLGVIGCTSRGTLSDHAHKPDDGVRIVAGADIYPDARELFLKRHEEKFQNKPNVYEDYREMIEKENLDGVFVTAPDFLHEEMGVFALEHKVPVYMEKPLAITLAGADRILETAYRNRTKLVVGHNMRYMDFTRKMKQLIDAGEIGEVKTIWCRHFICYGGDAYFKDWHAVERYANTMLLQKGAHDIDIIHWLANGYSTRVNGMGNLTVYDKLPRRDVSQKRIPYTKVAAWSDANWPPEKTGGYYPEIEVNDLNMIQMTLDNGVLACYMQCHYAPDSCRNYTIIGTRGRIENHGGNEIQLWNNRECKYRILGDNTYRMPTVTGGHGGADPRIVQSFIDALREKYDVWSTPQAARYSVAAGCAGADSMRQGNNAIDIPKLPDYLENFDFARATEKENI